MFNLIKFKEQRGLTLVEAMVSLLVLTLGLIPSIAIITSSLNLASLIKNNLIAANLAEEGIEVTRSLRDANWFLEAPTFYDGLIDPNTKTGTWQIDSKTNWEDNTPLAILPGNAEPLKFDSATGLYNYTTGLDTNFTREVTVTLSPNVCDCDLIVISKVSWSERGKAKSIQAETHLFNWR